MFVRLLAAALSRTDSSTSIRARPINDTSQNGRSRRRAIFFCLVSLLLAGLSVAGLRNFEGDFWSRQTDPLRTEFATEVLEHDAVADESEAHLPEDTRPNIVLINLDDAERELIATPVLEKFLPNIHRLATTGLQFSNCHVTTPLCGPSRACLLYSQHAHRTGIRANRDNGPLANGYAGGYQVLVDGGIARQHVGTWMQSAGYRTLAVGKYLHELPDTFAAPGWDEILMARGDRYFKTYFTRARNGEEKIQFEAGEGEFRTDLESTEMQTMLELHKTITFARRRPFFFYLAPMAPHEPTSGQTMIAPRHVGLGEAASLPWSESFDEDDMSDKPDQFKALRPLGRYRMVKFKKTFRRRVEALMSVDEQIGKLCQKLDDEGELNNTWIFLTSDHGYLLGHHRMVGKQVPYNRSTNVPLIVWHAKIEKRSDSRAELSLDQRVSDQRVLNKRVLNKRRLDHLVSHLDLAPTFLDLAGQSCPRSDGKSFAALLESPDAIDPGAWRDVLLIQNFERKRVFNDVCQCAYVALRTRDELYIQWANGQREYYDLQKDPDQLDNSWKGLQRDQRQAFEGRLRRARLATPTGTGGRPTEPVVTLANPTKFEPMDGDDFTISGMTEDDRAVDTVQLSIRHPGSKKFWNGAQWQSAEVRVEAELANRGGILSVWSYALEKEQLQGCRFLHVNAIATNKRGVEVTSGVVEARYPPPAVAAKSQNAVK